MSDNDAKAKEFRRAQAALRSAIIRNRNLSPAARIVGHEIADMVNMVTGFAWPAQDTLAEMLGLNERTVRRAIRDLNGTHFYIERNGRGHRYRPIWLTPTPDNMSTIEGKTPDNMSAVVSLTPDNFDRDTGQKRPATPDKNVPLSFLREPKKGSLSQDHVCNSPEWDRWNSIKADLTRAFGHDISKSWFDRLTVQTFSDDQVVLIAHSQFAADRVNRDYHDVIASLCCRAVPTLKEIIITTGTGGR